MPNKFLDQIRNKHELIFKVLLFFITISLVVLLLPREGKFKYEFQKNKPWVHEDLLAPFDFAINKSTEEIDSERILINENQLLYFNVNSKIKDERINYFQNWVLQNYNDSLRIEEKDEILKKGIKYLTQIYNIGIIEIIDELEDKEKNYSILLMGEDKVGEEVEIGNLYTIKTAYDFVATDLSLQNPKSDKFLLSAIENSIQQNIKFDAELTQKDLENELINVSLVKGGVYENERIISTGELVVEEKYLVLHSLKAEYESKSGTSGQSMWIVFGQVIIVMLLFYAIFIFLKNVNTKVFNNNMDILFLSIIVVGFVAITVFTLSFKETSVYIIPFCIIPLLIRTFFGNRLALFIYIITILLISFIVPNSFEFVLLETITGIITLYTVLNVNKRAELFYTSFIIFIVFSLSYLGLSLLQEGNIKTITWSKFGWFGIAAGLTLVTYPLIYLFEKIFGYISDVTLLELCDTNNSLLRELNLKAPGTFQHSLQVSNLAEEAIREIGGNPLLVRAGALYHDIGKIFAPAYFIENQTTVNPHDELSYEESADIIINHVIKGIEIAKANKIPEHIIDFIRTHHGTTKTQYFLRMSRNDNPDLEINDEIFQYPGPVPYSKETAVLMMADSVEAASRSLKQYNTDSISELVENIINSQINENQFIYTDITFNDITTIKNLFIKKIINIYHVRIEYPE